MKKYATIKDRKAVAMELARRQGLGYYNDEIIAQVGQMSDDKIIKFIDEEIGRTFL